MIAVMSGSASGLRDHVGYWLRRLSDEVHLSFERKLAAHGVTVAQWNVLVTLYRGEGETVAEVARFIETDAAAVSRLVDRLAEKGLVARFADPASRRRVLLALTPPAAGLVPMLAGLADQNDEAFFGTLPSAERAALAGLLQRLVSEARTVSRDTHDKEKES
jgi:MarR family transcriptional regulator, organic hydroperoxide resistance regulator